MLRFQFLFQPIKWLMFFILSMPVYTFAASDTAEALFSEVKQSILQIRVVDIASGSKSAIGSGFFVDSNGLIATNYHVVEQEVSKPDKYRVEFLTHTNQMGELQLVDVDVVNDLALLQSVDLPTQPLQLMDQEPEDGMSVYALGNPLDLGLTLVPGTYNGLLKGGFHPRMHFTGSLNPGMSGGPTLDTRGSVVGINVASSGNQVSFLVPASQLQRLLTAFYERGEPVVDFVTRIRDQLLDDEEKKFAELLDMPWDSISLGEAKVLKELRPFVKCWGGSNSSDPKAQFLTADRTCRSQDDIYLNSKFNTGTMEYQFFWLQANKLNSWRFYNYYEKLFQDFIPGNRASEDDVTNFKCEDSFTVNNTSRQYKTLFCTRAYRNYPDLYDVLFLQGTVDDAKRAFVSHFTLAGVSKRSSLSFTKRFMEYSQWH